jgi:hypothetical protein
MKEECQSLASNSLEIRQSSGQAQALAIAHTHYSNSVSCDLLKMIPSNHVLVVDVWLVARDLSPLGNLMVTNLSQR